LILHFQLFVVCKLSHFEGNSGLYRGRCATRGELMYSFLVAEDKRPKWRIVVKAGRSTSLAAIFKHTSTVSFTIWDYITTTPPYSTSLFSALVAQLRACQILMSEVWVRSPESSSFLLRIFNENSGGQTVLMDNLEMISEWILCLYGDPFRCP